MNLDQPIREANLNWLLKTKPLSWGKPINNRKQRRKPLQWKKAA